MNDINPDPHGGLNPLPPLEKEVLAHLIYCFSNFSGFRKMTRKSGDYSSFFNWNTFGCYMSYLISGSSGILSQITMKSL